MGSTRHGWCKKLMAKDKAFKIKKALGTSGRFHVDAVRDGSVKTKERDGLPRVAMVRRRVRNGCMLSPEIRAEVERRAAAREVFLAGLKG